MFRRAKDVEPVLSMVADYWLERPDGSGLVQLAFATPMVSFREPMLELFDAIASALYWVRADGRDNISPAD